jgi:hypothetical protein
MIGFLRPLNLGDSVIKNSSKNGYCFNNSSIFVFAFISIGDLPLIKVNRFSAGWVQRFRVQRFPKTLL